ncbi:Phage portal [Streptococcus infantarius subsp. infantarius]|nr:Phage portal [Streptococcus infantarius subsp. infantarius]MCO4657603.1 Phage portal [Streptococcus infantarius subsp. infantarius]
MAKFLSKTRFNPHSNDQIIMLTEDYEAIDFASQKWIEQLKQYINTHKLQIARLEELKRYYLGDNNIKYRPDKTDEFAADNRISSDFAKYITVFEQGYMLGNPVKYTNEDKILQELIDTFSEQTNEAYHNILIKTDLSIYGRAYELLNPEEDENSGVILKLYHLAPEQTFVIYDDTYQQKSLLGVNYYEVDYGGGHRKTVVRVYSDNTIYTYIDDNQDTFGLHLVDEIEHYLKGVPVNEFKNNEDRTGAYESVLDDIDAYDLSQSELANFQQNSNDAILLITGNPYTGSDDNDYLEDGRVNPNGRLGVALGFKKAQIAVLDDNPNPGGSQPDAKYLVKQYDSAGAEAYKQRLVNDILRFTFTPDILDNNFSGIQSGESMKYKLMASDNYRSKQERLFKKGLMRRLRLAVNIWEVKGNEATNYQAINQTAVIFSPNLPQNDTELANIAKSLFGVVSDQTVYELLEQVTGIDAEDELKRLKAEEPQEPEPRIGEVTADDQEEAQ